jgi:hypothetical protein
MQWPGIDILTDQTHELITAKQCSSVAAQLGKERVLSELYGCTGWDWPLEGHKFQGDWQFAAGVNFRCQHLTHYSLAGGAKRDYPASIIDHSPWWRYYRVVEDYFGRLSLMLTQGRPVRDVLLLHPIESVWGLHSPVLGQPAAALTGISQALTTIQYALTGQHHDWDFGDESLLAQYGEVVGHTLRVGRMDYRLVIVPPCVTLRSSTVALLRRFQASGGRLLFAGAPPTLVDAEPSEALAELIDAAACCDADAEAFLPTVEDLLPRRVSLVERDLEQTCLWTMLREIEGGLLLFVQSHDRAGDHDVQVQALGSLPVVEWDLLSGARRVVEATPTGDGVQFRLTLGPSASALLSLGVSVPEAQTPAEQLSLAETRELKGPYAIELTEPNTLPLDYCTFSVDGEPFSEAVPTLKADELIRARYGLGTRLGDEHQPWYLYATGVVDTAPRGQVTMRFPFHVTTMPGECRLAIERPQDYGIRVNGGRVSQECGYWVDEDIRTLDITEHLLPGGNEVALTFDYRPDMELEDLYLVGDLGTTTLHDGPRAPGNLTLIAAPGELEWGSWVGQGLDFYGAAVRYKLTMEGPGDGQHVRLVLPDVACTMAAIHANGQTFVLPWAPLEADITKALRAGKNEVVVEVVGGRKNILGPLHTPWGPGTGPHSFSPDHPEWTREYQLTDHGLMAPPIVQVLE